MVTTPRPVPATKTARQGLVRELLAVRPVRSQPELARLLADRGVTVTQATLSRDLDELGAVRVRDTSGELVYVVPDDDVHVPDGDGSAPAPGDDPSGRSRAEGRLARLLGDLVLSVEATGGTVVLRTPPGAAQFVASHLDRASLPEIAGTVAGDDTVLLVCRDAPGRAPSPSAASLSDRLLALAGRRS